MASARMATCILVALTLMFAAGASTARGQSQRPNILLILADDLGWSDLPAYGGRYAEAPNLDRLASQGVRFTSAYAAGAVCSPTRASILSGQYQARFGMTDFVPGHLRPYERLRVPELTHSLPDQLVTLGESLKQGGYATAFFGKWHLGSPAASHGFDVVDEQNRHVLPDGTRLSDHLAKRTIDFINQRRDEPFFVYLCPYLVHIPLDAPQELVRKYQNKPADPDRVSNPTYAAMIEELDGMVGRILADLDRTGLAKNTLVIFTSDNGGLYAGAKAKPDDDPVTDNLPLRNEKGSLYEGGIRVPLIVRYPGVTPTGAFCDEPVISVDFYPTALAAAGIKPPASHTLDGVSLMPLFKQPGASQERQDLYWHYPHYHHSRPAGAIRSGPWKLIEFFDDSSLELYNLDRDIGEQRDLASREPQRAQQMQQRLAAWRKQVNAAMPTPNPEYDPRRAAEWGERERPNRKRGKQD